MSIDQLPSDFAPYHVVRLDTPVAQGAGRFFDLGIAASQLDYFRKLLPEQSYGILSDGGLIDDSKIERKPLEVPVPKSVWLRAPEPKRQPKFRIVRKAA